MKKKKEKLPDIDFRPKTSDLLAILPEHLKDPANYEKIERAILDTLSNTCSHGEMLEWANCLKCTQKMLERRELLKRLGFKNPAQYMAWKKVHEKIKERYPLVDWKKEQLIKLNPNG